MTTDNFPVERLSVLGIIHSHSAKKKPTLRQDFEDIVAVESQCTVWDTAKCERV